MALRFVDACSGDNFILEQENKEYGAKNPGREVDQTIK